MISVPAYPYGSADRRVRFLRDPRPVRLGNLASTLARVSTCAGSASGHVTVQNALAEAIHFIEWMGPEAEPANQPNLVEIQVELAQWRILWPNLQDDSRCCELGRRARELSDLVRGWSGLLEA